MNTMIHNALSVLVSTAGMLLLTAAPSGATHFPFRLSQPEESRILNNVWTIYGVAEAPPEMVGSATSGVNPAWMEWETHKFRWTDHNGARARLLSDLSRIPVNGANAEGKNGDGYVWSWTDREAWPDEDGSGRVKHNGVPSFHYDQVPRYIVAIHNAWAWTGDQRFFETMFPRAERVMESYLLETMKGSAGLLIAPRVNDGTSKGRPSNYMDQWRAGHEDAWTNAAWLTALQAMAAMEEHGGYKDQAQRYRRLAERVHSHYDRAFWNPTTQRYVGWRDVNGVRHDSGYVMVNLEALARGLGDADKAFRVFRWLERPAAPTAGGSAAGSRDVYQNVIAPRTNTEPIPPSDWDGWSDPPDVRKPYGTLVEDGSTLHWLAYYDVMARLRHWDADSAWERLSIALHRYDGDPRYLTFRNRVYTSYNEDWSELLANMPENGIVPAVMVDGFLGITAGPEGLRASPNLPMTLLWAEVRDVDYRGRTYTVRAARGRAVSEQPGGAALERLEPGGILSQRFTSGRPFNEVGIRLRVEGKEPVKVTVEVRSGADHALVVSRRVACRPGERWQYIPLPEQPGGTACEVRLRNASGTVSWRRDAGSLWGTGAQRGEEALTGAFAVAAVSAPRKVLIVQDSSSGSDRLETTLAQTFRVTERFDQVEAQAAALGAEAGCTLLLYRMVGARWEAVTDGLFVQTGDGAGLVLRFAPQPAGLYRLEMRDPVGTIGWRRNERDVMPGSDNAALADGRPVAGDRAFRVSSGEYEVSIRPERSVKQGESALLVPADG